MKATLTGAGLAIAVCLLGAVIAADLLICPQCGYEGGPGAALCSHCGAELPQPAPAPILGQAVPDPARHTEVFLDVEVVEAEMALGREHLQGADHEVARYFFRNAAALDMLTDPGVVDGRSDTILNMARRCEEMARAVQRPCPECGGSGKRMMRSVALNGEVEFREVPGRRCGACGGKGQVVQAGTIDEMTFTRGRAVSRYTKLQQARKLVPVGGAWIPPEVEKGLSLRQSVLLKRATAAPCGDCVGFGRIDCAECGAAGMVACPQRDCKDGLIKVERVGQLVRGSITRRDKCKTCRGRSEIACPVCRGKGSVLCKACSGTGERPPCSRCSGQGFMPCSRCRATGAYKGVACNACGGEEEVVCRTCNGSGRKQR